MDHSKQDWKWLKELNITKNSKARSGLLFDNEDCLSLSPVKRYIIPLIQALGLMAGSFSLYAKESDIQPYLKIYPEWKIERPRSPSQAGQEVGTMGSLRNDRTVLVTSITPREDKSETAWSNSYVGIRGGHAILGARIGFDLQYEIDAQGDQGWEKDLADNFRSRDAYLYAESTRLGRIQVGKFDSIYKDWGDRYSMLGVSSGNFVSSSRLLSRAGWRGSGNTSFHIRRNYSLQYTSPRAYGVDAGIFHSFNESERGPGGEDTKVSALGIRWQDDRWYVALLTERHIDWLPMSRDASPIAESIRNPHDSSSSRDQAYRLAIGWSKSPIRIGLDIAQLRYSERSSVDLPGKFREYQNETAQITVEYRGHPSLRLSANHTVANAGRCRLSQAVPCSTNNLGGSQTSVGAAYAVNSFLSFFALASRVANQPAASYGSLPQGASASIFALGIKVEMR